MSTRKPLVICVEDDYELIELFATMLPVLGYAFIGVFRRPEAGSILLRDCPDVMLVDIMLSGPEDGIEYATRIRDRGITCPIVAMSASTHMLELARASGLFVACVAKPFDMFELARVLSDVVHPTED